MGLTKDLLMADEQEKERKREDLLDLPGKIFELEKRIENLDFQLENFKDQYEDDNHWFARLKDHFVGGIIGTIIGIVIGIFIPYINF